MKSILTILILVFALTANAQSEQFESIGDKIKAKNAVPAIEFAQTAKSEEPIKAKLTGEVESVCEVKGCWMKLKLADGKSMRVSFKDYGFFMPKDIVGKTVIIEGEAKVKSTPVDELKHYAEDAGKSKEEIAKITMPEKALTFVASGVLIKK
jgi:hypothetical protein